VIWLCIDKTRGLLSRGFIARIMLRAGSRRGGREAALQSALKTRPPPTHKPDTGIAKPANAVAQLRVKMLTMMNHANASDSAGRGQKTEESSGLQLVDKDTDQIEHFQAGTWALCGADRTRGDRAV